MPAAAAAASDRRLALGGGPDDHGRPDLAEQSRPPSQGEDIGRRRGAALHRQDVDDRVGVVALVDRFADDEVHLPATGGQRTHLARDQAVGGRCRDSDDNAAGHAVRVSR
jgi:hypothetical protein